MSDMNCWKGSVILVLVMTLWCWNMVEGDTTGDQRASVILKKADESRSPWPSFKMKAALHFKKRGEMSEETYRVYLRDGIKTLVAFMIPFNQKGNLLLMVGEDLWFYVKDTNRPTRITPLQRLSAGVSYGDIARLNWSQDYEPAFIGKETIEMDNISYPSIQLGLTARSKGATYHRIRLWIEEATGYPRKADVYLQSGKWAKTLYFTNFELTHGKAINREIKFVDHLNNDEVTIMSFSEIEVVDIPTGYFLSTKLPDISFEAAR